MAAKSADPNPAATVDEFEDTGVLTPKQHMQMIQAENARVEQDAADAAAAQVDAAKANLKQVKADIKDPDKPTPTAGVVSPKQDT